MTSKRLQIVGWREWIQLPELGIPCIKAKIDTGARTSALHTFDLETYRDKGASAVYFKVHPYQNSDEDFVECHCPVVDQRMVSDSGGHKERRYVIATEARMGESTWQIEMTLTRRDTMRFRMLLGRTAMLKRFIVNPGKSYLSGNNPFK